MTNTNYPSATPTTQPQRSNNSKNIVIGLLAVALLGSWAYFLMKINRSDKEILSKTEEGVHYMSQRDSLESLYKFTLDKRSEEHTSELQSQSNLVCRLLL